MEMLDNAVNWFEIPVADFERAKKFYSTIYDYTMPEAMVGKTRMGFLLYEQKELRVGGAIWRRIYTHHTRCAHLPQRWF
jgi:predicted enzyme related to lactoylglutathione lyase